MSLAVRVIPCLDVDAGRVVKGVNFEACAMPAIPWNWPPATTPRAPTNSSSSTSRQVPAVGRPCSMWCGAPPTQCSSPDGGRWRPEGRRLRRVAARRADKVGVNTGAIADPDLLTRAARRFGNQCVVLSVDARRARGTPSGFEITTHGGARGPASMRSHGPEMARASVPGKSCSTAWTPTAQPRGFDDELIGLVRAASRCARDRQRRSGDRAGLRGRRTPGPTLCSPPASSITDSSASRT